MSDPRYPEPQTFEKIVDACLGDIAAGRRGVEECLARHPELRAKLEPLLRAAAEMRSLPRFDERPPDPARRASLLAEIGTTSQRSARLGLPRLAWPSLSFPSFGTLGRVAAYATPAVLIALFALLLITSREIGTAQASSLAVFSGGVERQIDGAWLPIESGAELSEGDRLRTTTDGRALITFADGSTVALEPSTELVLLRVRGDGAREVEIEHVSGTLWNDVAPVAFASNFNADIEAADQEGGSYIVRTPEATVRVSGTVFSTQVRPGETEVTAAEGSVEVEADGERVTLSPHETVVARAASEARDRLERRSPAPSSTLTVDAPFAASVVSQHGQATGVQPQGEVHQHLPGATTTMPNIDGPQQLRFLAGFPPGEYTLILRRFDDGAGVLLVRDADGATRRIPIDRDVTTELRLLVRVTREAGAITIDVLSADAPPPSTDVRETLPTPRPTATDRPREAATATPTATRPQDLAAMREQYVLAIRAEYLTQLGSALQGGEAPALTTALRAATEGDATVVRLLVLGEQLRNRNVQLRIIQLLGHRPTLALSLWLDEGGDNLEALRAAVLTTLARVEGDRDDSGSGRVPSDRPAEDGARAEATDVGTPAVAIDSVESSDER